MAERLWFLSLVVVSVVAVMVFGAWRALQHLSQTLEFFLLQCSKNAGQLIGYCLSYDNFWKIIAVVVFGSLVAACLGALIVQVRRTRLLQAQLASKVCAEWGNNVRLVLDERPFALTIGFFKPTVFVSSACVGVLSEVELAAVLTHEHYHQINRHPLGLLLLRSVASLLAFVPLVRSWVAFAQTQYELLADRFTLRRYDRTSIAAALLKMSELDKMSGSADLAFAQATVAGFSVTPARTVFLEAGQLPRWSWSRRSFIASIFSVVACSALLQHVIAAPIEVAAITVSITQEQITTCAGPVESVASLMSFGRVTAPMSVFEDVMSSEDQTIRF